MKFNRFNQIEIEDNEEILSEQFSCSSCEKLEYSSIYMEKISSTNPIGNTISSDSKVDRIFYCKCDCGKSWLEKYNPKHHRPIIRYVIMRNFL